MKMRILLMGMYAWLQVVHYRVLNSGDSVLASLSPADIIPGDPWRTANRLQGLGKSHGENSQIGWRKAH